MGEVFRDFRDNNDLRVAIITGGGDKFFALDGIWLPPVGMPWMGIMALAGSVACRKCET